MRYNARKFYPVVRKMCNEEGWKVQFTYSDKRKNDRRVSFAGASYWRLSEERKERILKRLQGLMDEYGVKGKPYWHEALRYGPYDKLCIAVPNE